MRSLRPLKTALGASLALGLQACTTTVVPPANVAEPARIGVLDHGNHASLVLEVADGRTVQYAYGEWRWYAMEQTGVIQGLAAVLWPTRAALGRKRLPVRLSPASVADQIRVPVEDAVYLMVEAEDVARLVGRLDRMFEEHSEARVVSGLRDLEFVPHPEPYWIGHNSNRVLAGWLEELGCRVEGPTILSDWRLADPLPESPR